MVLLPLGQPEAPKSEVLKNEQALWTQEDLLGLRVLELKALLQVWIPEFRWLQGKERDIPALGCRSPAYHRGCYRLLGHSPIGHHGSSRPAEFREKSVYRQRQNLPWPKVLQEEPAKTFTGNNSGS